MISPKGYGTFHRVNSYIFRTEAKIHFGESTNPLGLLIMLNPGSSKLADSKKWSEFIDNENKIESVSGEIVLDDTMKAIAHILKKSHPNLDGILTIHNLFNLQDTESNSALACYKGFFCNDGIKLNSKSFDRFIKEAYKNVLHTYLDMDFISQFPWIWIAWTVNDGNILNARKKQILANIPDSLHRFVYYSKQACHQSRKELYTYHVWPQRQQDKEDYEQVMIKQMRDYWNQ